MLTLFTNEGKCCSGEVSQAANKHTREQMAPCDNSEVVLIGDEGTGGHNHEADKEEGFGKPLDPCGQFTHLVL